MIRIVNEIILIVQFSVPVPCRLSFSCMLFLQDIFKKLKTIPQITLCRMAFTIEMLWMVHGNYSGAEQELKVQLFTFSMNLIE